MDPALTDRQTVAAVLATLVRSRTAAAVSGKTSRTGLQASVPVSERPSVRRGIDALIELGVLAMSGEDIGFTTKGKMFLASIQRARDETPTVYEQDDKDSAHLAALLGAIDEDERFTPYRSVDEMRTLPSRLEGGSSNSARGPRLSRSWLVMGGLAAVAAAVALLR
ncbi:MAG TPA: hypothetical protein VGI11_13650 [Variovorax sp.]